MSPQESEAIKELRKALAKWGVGIIGTGLVGAIAFYYNTNNKLDEHDKRFNSMESQMDKKANADELKDFKYTMREDFRSLHTDVRDLKNDQQKILEILLEKQQ